MKGVTEPPVYPLWIPLTKENHDGKPNKYVFTKPRRDTTLPTSEFYEFKMSLFDNGDPEVFLFFVCKFNMTLVASGTLEAGTQYQDLRNIFHVEALRQFDSLSADVEIVETLNFYYIVRGLAQYFPPVKFLSKQKSAIRCGMETAQPNCKTLCGAFH